MNNKRGKTIFVIALMLFITIVLNTVISYNYEYVNVTSKVNITNAYPIINSLVMSQSITLRAGTTTTVWCNVSITDWNGWNDINLTNATFWDADNASMGDADNVINHYTNSSCNLTGNDGQFVANYSCAFTVWYYANPSVNWTCNVTVMDDYNFTDVIYNDTTINSIYSVNLSPSTIDFGNMASGAFSANITANITNIGNKKINVSVRGYGSTNPATGSGYAMICEQGNITIGNLKYSTNVNDDFAAKTALTSNLVNISGFSLDKRSTDSVWNLTYWQLYTDPTNAPSGLCNGTIEFTAEIG